jgi:Sec-independent protein translocase protein TatA
VSKLRTIPALALVALLAFVVGGCESKPTHESVMKDMVGKMKEFVSTLEGVKDEASAEAAKPKLQALNKEMKELQTKASQLPKASPEEEKRLRDKYEPELKELMPKMMAAGMKIAMDPKLSAILKDSMGDGPPSPLGS